MGKVRVLLFCCFLMSIQHTTGFTDRDVKGINKFVKNIMGNPSTSVVTKIESFPDVTLFGEHYRFKLISELMIPITRVSVEKGRYYYSSSDQGVSFIWGANEKVYNLKCGQKDPLIERRMDDIKDNINITQNVMKIVNETAVFIDGNVVEFPKEYKRFKLAQYSNKIGFVLAFNKAEDAYGYLYTVNLDIIPKQRQRNTKKLVAELVLKDLEDSIKDIVVDQLTGNVIMAAGKSHSDFLLMLEKIYPKDNQVRSAKMMVCPPVKECPVNDCSRGNPHENGGEIGLIAMQNVVQRAGDMILQEYEQIVSESNGGAFCSLEKNEIQKQAKEIDVLKAKLEQSRLNMDQMRIAFTKRIPYTTGARLLPVVDPEEVKEEVIEDEAYEIEADEV